MAVIALILFGIGGLLTLWNFYVSFIRYPAHLLFGGTRETYQWVSGVPLFGSLLLWISIPMLSSVSLQWFAAILSVFDTAGFHWFVGTMWWTGQWWPFIRHR